MPTFRLSMHTCAPTCTQDASGVEWSVRVLPRRAQAPTVPIFFAVMKMQLGWGLRGWLPAGGRRHQVGSLA